MTSDVIHLKKIYDNLKTEIILLVKFQNKYHKDIFENFAKDFYKRNYLFEEYFDEALKDLEETSDEYEMGIKQSKLESVVKLQILNLKNDKDFYEIFPLDKEKFNKEKNSLTEILKTILEASIENDANKSQKANEYVNKIKSLISGYKKNTKEILVGGIGSYSYVITTIDELEIKIIPTDNGNAKARFEPKTSKTGPLITVYGANIKRDPKLSVTFDEKHLYHELIHYFDYQNVKTDPNKIDKSYKKTKDKKGYAGYINNPFEVNAHFFEYFMPEVVKFIEREKEIPETFDKFKDGLMRDPKAKEFIDDLDDKNRKKVLKRLGTYYNHILTNPKLKIEKDDKVDDQQLKSMTSKFIEKLKSVLKVK